MLFNKFFYRNTMAEVSNSLFSIYVDYFSTLFLFLSAVCTMCMITHVMIMIITIGFKARVSRGWVFFLSMH